MRVLIVEDDPNKLEQLVAAIADGIEHATIVQRRSYQSGLREALCDPPFEIIVADMTLPTYDVTSTESGGRTRVYGGKEILRELARRRVPSRVVIVTQFESFGQGDQRKTLHELSEELAQEHSGTYHGTVFYHPAQTGWRTELLALCR